MDSPLTITDILSLYKQNRLPSQLRPGVGQQLLGQVEKYGARNYLVPYARYGLGVGPYPGSIPATSNGMLASALGYGGGSTGGTLAAGPVGGLLGNYLGLGTELVGSGAPVVGAEASLLFGDAAVPAAFATDAAASGTGAAIGASTSAAGSAAGDAAAGVAGGLSSTGIGALVAAGIMAAMQSGNQVQSTIKGEQSPGAGFTNSWLDPLGILGMGGVNVAHIFGIDTPPTQGTQFRQGLKKYLDKQNIKLGDYSKYNIDLDAFNKRDKTTRDTATKLGEQFLEGYKTKPKDYAIQAQNLLLNNLTDAQIKQLAPLLKKTQKQDQATKVVK